MTDFDQFERRLAAAVRSDADQNVDPFEAGQIARAAIAGTRPARRFGRGRGMTLLAAAALLLVGGALAGSGLLRLPSVVPPVPEPSVIAVATASLDATPPSPSELAAPSAGPIPVAGAGGVWIPVGSMGTPRFHHGTVRLLDGRVLVLGGCTGRLNCQQHLTSAELYDPSTGTWSAAGSISTQFDTATLLRDGKVLVLVGNDDGGPRSAEVYDPASGSWTATGPTDPGMEDSGGGFTVLQDGRVLLAGLDGAQVYDPASGSWTSTGPMITGCCGTLVLLHDGRVLDIGGDQVFDPASGTWTATGTWNKSAFGATPVVLSDGKVLVPGGTHFDGDYRDLDSASVYDPVTGSWTAIANMPVPTRPGAAFVQSDGKVLVLGSSAAQVYDPATGTWSLSATGVGGDVTLLSDGAVLVTGSCAAADLYDPLTGTWTTASTMLGCGRDRSFTLLPDGTVLAAGGIDCNGDGECASNGTAELYVPAGVALPPLPAFPSPPPFVLPSPTPLPPMLPPAAGPVPPNARSWTITVDNESSDPAALFVAVDGDNGTLRLVGSATPNVVPAGTSMQVTFRFPAKGVSDRAWITVNPRQGEGADIGPAGQDSFGIPGQLVISGEGDVGWVSP